jgi:hypothetical protein
MAATSTADERHAIQVHVADLAQVYNSMDPTPFHNRDLDPVAEDFIVEWARELPRSAYLSLQVQVDGVPRDAREQETLVESIHRFFEGRTASMRRRLRLLFHRGRISLLIGVAFLSSSLIASEMLGNILDRTGLTEVLRESLLIGGWVAMWRPIEIFLYDWWPLRADMRLFERLRDMPVSIHYGKR